VRHFSDKLLTNAGKRLLPTRRLAAFELTLATNVFVELLLFWAT